MQHQFPQFKPPVGQTKQITLASGGTLTATWDGLQWWAGVDGQPDDVPVANDFVISWEDFT